MVLGLLWSMNMAFAADIISMSNHTHSQVGGSPPFIEFTINEPGTYRFSLDCGDGGEFAATTEGPAGHQVKLELTTLKQGTWSCRGQADIQLTNGQEGNLPFTVPASLTQPLELSTTYKEIDLTKRTALIHANQPVVSGSFRAIGARGATVAEGDVALLDPTTVQLTWTETDTVVKLEVVVADSVGQQVQGTFTPWSYAIPHEDIQFDSGSTQLTSKETPKLDDAWKDVEHVHDLYGMVVPMQLYVGGYTDTVGSPSQNRLVSTGRARAIARWFQQRGFNGDIFYQGFGEAALATPTQDEVAEPTNRRAVYLLTATTPSINAEFPAAQWTKL